MPWEYTRWKLAREFGWTLEYIDTLGMGDLEEYWQVTDATTRARAK